MALGVGRERERAHTQPVRRPCASSRHDKGNWVAKAQDERTNRSSVAVPKVDFLGDSFNVADMSMRSREASLLNSASKVVMKGLRDIGLLPELERLVALAGEGKPGEGLPGEAALRKGLLEERLSCKPGEGRRSVDKRREISDASKLGTTKEGDL